MKQAEEHNFLGSVLAERKLKGKGRDVICDRLLSEDNFISNLKSTAWTEWDLRYKPRKALHPIFKQLFYPF